MWWWPLNCWFVELVRHILLISSVFKVIVMLLLIKFMMVTMESTQGMGTHSTEQWNKVNLDDVGSNFLFNVLGDLHNTTGNDPNHPVE